MTIPVVSSGCGSLVKSAAQESCCGSVRSAAATSTPVSTISTGQAGSQSRPNPSASSWSIRWVIPAAEAPAPTNASVARVALLCTGSPSASSAISPSRLMPRRVACARRRARASSGRSTVTDTPPSIGQSTATGWRATDIVAVGAGVTGICLPGADPGRIGGWQCATESACAVLWGHDDVMTRPIRPG